MFESLDPDPAVAAVDAIMTTSREENAAGARRLAAIGDLYALRAPEDDIEKQCWVIDGYAGLVVEVAAALGVSRHRAKAQLEKAIALRERLPNVAAVYAKGLVDAVMIAMIITRTDLILDDAVAARVDEQLAAKISRWGRLSLPKMEKRIDGIIASIDPPAVRGPTPATTRPYVDIRPCGPGVATINARVDAATAALLDATLDGLADRVCGNDPRGREQRRAAAIDALSRGRALRCLCGQSDCAAAADGPAASGARAVIHVVATSDDTAPGYLSGYGPIPADQVTALREGAIIRTIITPADEAEARYRPSATLAQFVRCRDLTCRFPDCDHPAEHCDIDHTIAHPHGPTHPSNLKALCRFHHLVKTFLDWKDHQYPDGTLVWTAPTGHTYITTPEGAHWFPTLGTPTGVLPEPQDQPHGPGRALCMPTRTRTRQHERTTTIRAERTANQERLNQRHTQREREEANDEPAPF